MAGHWSLVLRRRGGRVVFLEELVAVVAREEASSLAGEAGKPRYAKPV
jgi:hypothetical protein